MITIINSRNNSGVIYENKPGQHTVSSALELMLIYEFGYGGRLVELTPTKVVIQTTIMACVDTQTITGSEEEMKLVVEAACLAHEYHPMRKGLPSEYRDAAMGVVMRETNGNPLLLSLGHGLLLGKPAVQAALLHMIAPTDEATVTELLKFSTKELLPIMTLIRIDGVSIEDALELAKAEPMFGADGKINGLATALEG